MNFSLASCRLKWCFCTLRIRRAKVGQGSIDAWLSPCRQSAPPTLVWLAIEPSKHLMTYPACTDTCLLQNVNVTGIACGAEHSLVSDGSGKVYSWGWGRYGNLGLGDKSDK